MFQTSFVLVKIENEVEVEIDAERKPLATEIIQIDDYLNGLQSPPPNTKSSKTSVQKKKKKEFKRSESVNPLESNESEAPAQYKTQHKCQFCDRCFASGWNLRQHIERHSDDRPYKCWLCHKA